MRKLTAHKVNEANESISINVMDEPGAGGAHHHYATVITTRDGQAIQDVIFQDGPIQEVGTNGTTQEVLLAIVADRLQSFQTGPYACRENALALTKIEEAMHWLHHRTRVRQERGVEGTHTI